MGQTTASLRGAAAGDTIDLMAANGSTVTFTIGLVAPDAEIGGTEILISTQQVDLLGATLTTRVLIYGRFDRTALQAALVRRGLYANNAVRVRTSWDAPDPDGTLSLARTKSLLGEFELDYANLSELGWTDVGATWRNAYLPGAREAYPAAIRAMCNKVIKADLSAALQEVVDAGLGGGIDAGNANTYGGMHFEWVGEARDALQYPSKYCPNSPGALIEQEVPHAAPPPASRGTLFADDGLVGE